MMKPILAAALLAIAATSVSAETLKCRQSSLSASGFTSTRAAQAWFPKTFSVAIKGSEAISDVYGKGTVSEEGGRKFITFVTATSNGKRTEIKMTYIPRSGRYTASLGALARYNQTPGSRGKCSRS